MSIKRRIIEWWKRCSLFLFIQKRINRHFAKKLRNENFTVLCSNCIGGYIYHRLGQQFNTPTINTYIKPCDFIHFCLHLDYYLAQNLQFIDTSYDYPVAQLIGTREIPTITVCFIHEESVEDAKQNWERRKTRVNKENLYVIYHLIDGLTAEEAKMLAGFPCNNIVLLAAKPLPDIPWSYYIKPNMRYQYPYTYLGKNIFGVCHFEREFDYVSFLNKR